MIFLTCFVRRSELFFSVSFVECLVLLGLHDICFSPWQKSGNPNAPPEHPLKDRGSRRLRILGGYGPSNRLVVGMGRSRCQWVRGPDFVR
mgnify:CR=1 FL=1